MDTIKEYEEICDKHNKGEISPKELGEYNMVISGFLLYNVGEFKRFARQTLPADKYQDAVAAYKRNSAEFYYWCDAYAELAATNTDVSDAAANSADFPLKKLAKKYIKPSFFTEPDTDICRSLMQCFAFLLRSKILILQNIDNVNIDDPLTKGVESDEIIAQKSDKIIEQFFDSL